jgi:hypothetical protein
MKKNLKKKPSRPKAKVNRPAPRKLIQKQSISYEEMAHMAEDEFLSGLKNRGRPAILQRKKARPPHRIFKDEQDFFENGNIELARAGVQVGDRFYLAFRGEDLDIEKGYTKGKGAKIPLLRVKIHSQAIVDIFGSHLKGEKDKTVTHVIHNKSHFELISIEGEYSPLPALHPLLVHSRSYGWTVSCGEGTKLKGDAIKTVFQGVSDDPDLVMILTEMEEIKKSSHDSYSYLPFPGANMTRHRVGDKLFDFLVRIVRSGEEKKLNLLQKCMDYLHPPTKTKIDRFTHSLSNYCNNHGRLPTPPELLRQIYADGYEFSNPQFYKSLNEIGLRWMSRERKKRN